MRLQRSVICFGLVLTLATVMTGEPRLLAQIATGGTVSGKVRSSDGGALPGATVTATSENLQGSRVTSTDSGGRYVLGGLPPGEYQITVSLDGFTTNERTVRVGAGQTLTLQTTLQASAVEETIIVSETPIIEVSNEVVSKLPLSDRNPFSTLPRVSSASVQNGRSKGQLGISGGLAYDNLFLLNGVSVADPVFGNAYLLFIEDAVESTTTQTSGVSAEYGRFTGGVVNAITKSGGNQFSGTLRAELSDSGFSGSVTGFETPETSDQVYEATLGGYVVKDRLWFFAAGRKDTFDKTQSLYSLGSTPAGLTAPFNADGLRYSGKLTGTLWPGQRLTASYVNAESDETGVLGVTNSATSNTLLAPKVQNTLRSVNYTGILTDNFFVEAQYSNRTFTISRPGGTSTNVLQSPIFSFSGAAVDGQPRNGNVPIERDSEAYRGSLTYLLDSPGWGSHTLKLGVESVEDIRSENTAITSTGVAFVTNFLTNQQGNLILDASGRATPVWQTNGSGAIVYPFLEPAVFEARTSSYYVNDQWRFNDKWSFNIGLRYEDTTAEAAGQTTINSAKVAPRLGGTYDLFGNGRSIIYASYGKYTGSVNSSLLSNGIYGARAVQAIYRGPQGSGRGFLPAYDPNNYQPFALTDSAASTVTDPETTPPTTSEFSVGSLVQRGRFSFSGNYIRRTTTGLIEDFRPFGQSTVLTVPGLPAAAVDTTRIGNSTTAERTYDALELTLSRTLADNWGLVTSYRWARLQGNYPGVTTGGSPATSVIENYPLVFPAARYAPIAPIDNEAQSHRLQAYGFKTFETGLGTLNLGAVGRFESGRQALLQVVSPLSNTQNAAAASAGYLNVPSSQALFFDGETVQFDSIFNLDLSATLTFGTGSGSGVYIKADVFNVLGGSGLESFDTTIIPGGSVDSQGQPTTFTRGSTFGSARSFDDFQAPRQFRFSVGFRF
jgi:outer membrane receptor protein involved in Fe transport